MAEDFTTYTEVDPDSHISVDSASKITLAGLARDEEAYVYKDHGTAHFDGDFEHLIDYAFTSGTSDNAMLYIAVLSNIVATVPDIHSAAGDFVGIRCFYDVDMPRPLWSIYEGHSGGLYYDYYGQSGYSLGSTIYFTLERDESVGTYGTMYCYIYSDADRTSLLDTLSLSLHVKADFKYAFPLNNSDNGNSGQYIYGTIESYDLQEGALIELSSALSGASQVADIGLAVCREFSSQINAESSLGDIDLLKMLRFLSSLPGISSTSDTVLAIGRALASVIAAASLTADISLAIARLLASTVSADSQTRDASLAILRSVSSQIDAGSSLGDIDLLKTLNYASALAGTSLISDIPLSIDRSLASAITADSQSADVGLAILREIASKIDAGTSLTDVELVRLMSLWSTLVAG
ncbi:MAG: hypothetical protein JW884_14295, partial [Deltaproteobacteria bacterium]|nr:hypothetical protein [Deltaproteobacteria bacterium]